MNIPNVETRPRDWVDEGHRVVLYGPSGMHISYLYYSDPGRDRHEFNMSNQGTTSVGLGELVLFFTRCVAFACYLYWKHKK